MTIPLGFALGAVAHPEGDPGIGIALVPLGAATLLYALVGITIGVWRAPAEP